MSLQDRLQKYMTELDREVNPTLPRKTRAKAVGSDKPAFEWFFGLMEADSL